ncbi:MAG: hypothetical protein QOI66_485 [Myxococcales bacterium]|nr:hypothetical protein [Myxococcales bacterium]
MISRFQTSLRTALALTATVLAHAAYGQPAASAQPAAPDAVALTPPKLVTFVDATYPPAAKAAGLQADVDLEMTIDATGKVTEARVVAPVGNGFDEAALDAARRFVFQPARRGDKAIAARISYRYVFAFSAEATPVPSPGELEGKVPSPGNDQSVAGASAPVEQTKQAATAEYGATATIEAPPREVTKRSLSGDELLRVAGTRGDPLKAIEYMPGVGRSPQAEFVIIRGASPADSEVQFEGAPVYRLYHFGGLTSFVQPRLLDKIDLYPGNFSARFGRKMGGIVDVGVRDPKTDALHGMVDINIIDSSFLIEGPITQNWSFAVAAKRSYIDLFIDKLVPKDEATITAAPVYWDYQAMLAYKPSDNDRFRAMVYGSYDDLKLILAHPADSDPSIRGGVSSASQFHRAQLVWQHKYNAAIEHEINVSVGPFSFSENVGPDVAVQIPGYDAFLRAEWRARLADQLRLIGGLDVSYNWFDFSYDGPRATQLDGDPDAFGPLTGRQSVKLHDKDGFLRPAGYLEALWQVTQRLTLVPGGRVDYLGDVHRWTVDPRLTGRYQLTGTTILKGGVGLFSQAPSGAESLPVLGNPHLRPGRAQHYSVGVEQDVGARLKLTAEGFYKRLSGLPVNSPVPGENLNNDGIGRIYGAEVSAKLRPTTKSSGFLSYTLSRSERNDHGLEWRRFNWDQTHILTVAGAYRMGRGWDLSGTFRYVTGNPITPVVGSVYNANTDTYKPGYGAINSARSNDFHRLDLRVEKSWHVKSGSIAAYLDVQNAYNRHNEEGRSYNYNFTKSGVISGLPLIPSLGVRGEL